MFEKKKTKVLLIVNLHKKDAQPLAKEIKQYLINNNYLVEFFGFEGKPVDPKIDDINMVISLGGDGTVLYAARLFSKKPVPILAINLGNIGFITEIGKDEWYEALENFNKGESSLSKRLLLNVNVIRDNKVIACYCGLNDCVVSADGISKIVKLQVIISNTPLGEYRADGIIVATPTGSTAYSLAAGGPILYPEMDAMIINPVCPFTLSNRPVVVPATEKVNVFIEKEQRTGVIMTIDGQTFFPLIPGDMVTIEAAEERATLIRSNKRNFFEVVRSKLNLYGGPRA